MARKSTPQGGAVDPTLSSEKAIELIERQIERADEILNLPYTDPKVNAWKNTTVNILEAAFGLPNGTPHRNSTEFNYASSGISGPSVYGRDSTAAFQHSHQLLTQKRKALLQGFVEQLRSMADVIDVVTVEAFKRRKERSSRDESIHEMRLRDSENDVASVLNKGIEKVLATPRRVLDKVYEVYQEPVHK